MDHASYSDDLVPSPARRVPTAAHSGELLPPQQQYVPPPSTSGFQHAFEYTIRSPALLIVLLLTLGPMALPLVVISPKLGVLTKVFLTVVTLGLTIVLPIALTIYFSHFAVMPALDAIRDANLRGGAI
ncbi:hypothetical protein M4951_01855 [Blastopirellula sp. J2-11]|uniref:hypothetical protein n=1 Tax=Blastopirellula sp. J2-11 TaxID=2943192 RepID=UPI0021C740C6|nr:hypothetical protein [Blastopirellula sp. J2-11]UUO07068.1 hypothetical protein M4951_01855 [Blastopirellula sp. J2-11]